MKSYLSLSIWVVRKLYVSTVCSFVCSDNDLAMSARQFYNLCLFICLIFSGYLWHDIRFFYFHRKIGKFQESKVIDLSHFSYLKLCVSTDVDVWYSWKSFLTISRNSLRRKHTYCSPYVNKKKLFVCWIIIFLICLE